MQQSKKICVCGSANGDYFMYVHHIPVPGQTIQASKYMTANGGKGANQAVAVGKLAGFCQFIGQVGHDDTKHQLQKQMTQSNVKLSWTVKNDVSTGKAFIYVDQTTGQNSIVIVGQANTHFDSLTQLADNFKKAIQNNDYLMLQKQIPIQIVQLAAKYGKQKGKKVILDCGGRDDQISHQLLQNLDYISPNQTELARLDPTINLDNIVEQVRSKIIAKYPNIKVLLKQGSKGSSLISNNLYVKCPSSSNHQILQQFKIVDTVGAGDCFTGAFAVKHAELDWSDPKNHQSNYYKAMRFGNSAAFLCITKKGAMPSMPLRKDVDSFINKYFSNQI